MRLKRRRLIAWFGAITPLGSFTGISRANLVMVICFATKSAIGVTTCRSICLRLREAHPLQCSRKHEMQKHRNLPQKTHPKSAPTSSGYWDLSNTPNSTAPSSEWVHEPEAATLLAIKQNTHRAMRVLEAWVNRDWLEFSPAYAT